APLGDCLRCRTTLGTSGGGAGLSAADGFEGSPIGAVVVLVGAGVVLVGAGVVLVGAGVVLVLGGCSALPCPGPPAPVASGAPAACPDPNVPSPGVPIGALSAPSAGPTRAPSPAAVSPPPASAEASIRRARLLGPAAGAARRDGSSLLGRPMVVVGAASPQGPGTPTGVYIGAALPERKGLVIAH